MDSRRGELVDELDNCPALLAVLADGGWHDDTACAWCAERVRALEHMNDYDRVWRERFGSGGGVH